MADLAFTNSEFDDVEFDDLDQLRSSDESWGNINI